MVEISDKEYQQLKERLKELEAAVVDGKRAEEALREIKECYRTMVENSIDGILVAIGGGGHVFANTQAVEITGYSIEELLKTSIKDLAHPDEINKLMERYRNRLERKPVPRQYETIIVRKDGKNVPVEIAGVKTVWKGEPADLVFIRDISERKRAEEELKTSEEKYRTLIECASDQIFMVNKELKFVSMNGAALSQLRKKPDEVIGKPVSEVFPKEISANNIENLEKVFKTGQNYSVEEELNFGGNKVFVSTSLSPVKNSKGETVAVLGIVRDFTERKRAEEAMAGKVKELEKITKIMEGREDRIIELKQRVKELEAQLK